MKKQMTIREVEKQICECEKLLSVPQDMPTWSKIVSIYNALKLKHCRMTYTNIIVTEGQTEHII